MENDVNIIIIETMAFGLKDAVEYFENKGHNIFMFKSEEFFNYESKIVSFEFEVIQEKIHGDVDFVFSLNYYPVISKICNEKGIKYIAVVYDNPHVALYHFSLVNSCNYVFVFDSSMYEYMKSGGVNTVHYSVLPINIKRYDSILHNSDDVYDDQVSFVGSMYNESHTLYDRLKNKLMEKDPETAGYLDGIIKAQSKIYGYNFLEELIDDELLKKIYKAYPYDAPKDSIVDKRYIYASYFFGRKVTEIERFDLLGGIGEKFPLSLYTKNNQDMKGLIINKGTVEYYNEMPYVFKKSKININITLKSIVKGIPLRALDIMGCGGFLLSNYQEDFLKHFVPGRDFVYFEDKKDMINKVEYYLENESERKEIALNGRYAAGEVCEYGKVMRDIMAVADINI